MGIVVSLTQSANSRRGSTQVGVGRAIGHHGELLQGVFEGEDGRLHRGLITLPFPARHSVATFWPQSTEGIRTSPPGRSKAARAIALTFEHLGYDQFGGDLTIQSNIPAGHGYGSSTADVVAAIRAAAVSAGAALSRATVSRLAVAAEGASDPAAYDGQSVLYAQREGMVIELFADEYPDFMVVGFRHPNDQPVDTLQLPPARYDAREIEQFRCLRGLAAQAIMRQDARLLGRMATASSRINQRYLSKSHFEDLLHLTAQVGACGLQVAHSGSLMGILFPAEEADVTQRTAALAERLYCSGFEDIMVFAARGYGAACS
ncbi:kinase [Bradyrhizobium septentrionale]|uniref:Kinase n=1 Tax=Bradyrhizobium septentrionale TaxID=1404411 RepID=A0A973W6F4_9BRAD|nr:MULTISPECIES: kinase [Bradyrhizobium]UGY16852.1 kinase [Bradyrhizobium septentrionale]